MYNQSENSFPVKTLIAIGLGIVLFIGSFAMFTFETVKGNEVGVMETFKNGIEPNPLGPKMYFRNRFTTTIYHYDLSSQVFVMNDVAQGKERGHGRDADAYLVQSSDQQDMHINLNVRWRIDPIKVIELHKQFHCHIDNNDANILEERLIRPAVMLIVKNHATKMKAMEAYSGEGLVRLQSEIESELGSPTGELRANGVVVENFVVEKIVLDPNFAAEIKARQIAQQKKLRADEETKAAESDAIKAKAVAQADLNTMVVQAERDKQVAILLAEQKSQSQVIAAKANAEQVVVAAKASAQQVQVAAEADAARVKIQADAERQAAEARAAAIKALGQANADARKLEYSAFSAPGAELYAQIEIAKSMSVAFGNINGYLPQNMTPIVLGDNFTGMVKNFMNSGNRQSSVSIPAPAATTK